MRKIVLSYFIGAILAVLTVWAVTPFFLNSVPIVHWDPVVKLYTLVPGKYYRSRTEGWASSRIDQHGVIGLSKATPGRPKVVLWGNSYVQGTQVADAEKMSCQAQAIWLSSGEEALDFLAIGQSGASMADYFFLYEHYAPIIAPVKTNVIVLGHMFEALPNAPSAANKFVNNPEYALLHRDITPHTPGLMRLLYQYRLEPIWQIGKLLAPASEIYVPWRFRPGPVARLETETDRKYQDTKPASSYLLDQFRAKWKEDIIFVYLPMVPRIEKGAISREDPQQDEVDVFEQECSAHAYAFCNMKDAFLELYDRDHAFPRGFSNSRPGSGHMNVLGHRLVAEAICAQLKTR